MMVANPRNSNDKDREIALAESAPLIGRTREEWSRFSQSARLNRGVYLPDELTRVGSAVRDTPSYLSGRDRQRLEQKASQYAPTKERNTGGLFDTVTYCLGSPFRVADVATAVRSTVTSHRPAVRLLNGAGTSD